MVQDTASDNPYVPPVAGEDISRGLSVADLCAILLVSMPSSIAGGLVFQEIDKHYGWSEVTRLTIPMTIFGVAAGVMGALMTKSHRWRQLLSVPSATIVGFTITGLFWDRFLVGAIDRPLFASIITLLSVMLGLVPIALAFGWSGGFGLSKAVRFVVFGGLTGVVAVVAVNTNDPGIPRTIRAFFGMSLWQAMMLLLLAMLLYSNRSNSKRHSDTLGTE